MKQNCRYIKILKIAREAGNNKPDDSFYCKYLFDSHELHCIEGEVILNAEFDYHCECCGRPISVVKG